jgi:methylenetetrahydrofolate reductase (NADH)
VLRAILAEPTFELIPLKRADTAAAYLPPKATVSVTSSASKGINATLQLTESLQAAGFRAVPHLAARLIRDRPHLRDVLARLVASGANRAFVVAGDADERGDYADGLALLRDMAELGLLPSEIGIPCYPQGHPFIADHQLLGALRAKAAFATYMTTQLCFDADKTSSWLAARHAEGLSLPAHIGVPGVCEPTRLLSIGARIGVTDTGRFVRKNTGLLARVIRSGGFYRPNSLLEALAARLAHAETPVGLHIYTFNAVRSTEEWRRSLLSRLAADP